MSFKMEDFKVAMKKANEEMKANNTTNNTSYDFIAQYIIDLTNPEDQWIIDVQFMTMQGGLNNECYFQECAANTPLEDIIEQFDSDLERGVYRIVFGVNCHGSKSETPWGTEYDAWETYETMSVHKYADEEAASILHDNNEMDDYERPYYNGPA